MSGLFAGSSGMQTRSKSAATAEATKADSASIQAHDISIDPIDPSTGAYDPSQTIQPDTDVHSDEEAQPIDPAMEDEIKEMINEFEIYLTKKKMAKKAKKAQKKKEEDSKKGKGRKPDGDPSDSSGTEGGDRTPRNRPTNRRRRRTPSPKTHDMGRIPKIRPMLDGAPGFAKWVHGLKIVLMMYDVDCAVDEYTYWSVVEGDLESWDEDTLSGYGLKLKTWNRMNGFILQTMRLNCEEGPLRLIGLAETASDAFVILKNNYENKQVADLGVALTSVTKMTFKEGTAIKTHIEEFESKWENMGNISAGHLKPELKEFGKLLQLLNINELAKKELLLATFPTHIMKYSQLVQNMRIKTDYTYGDLVSNLKQYVPQLEWKKKDHGNGGTGSKENPVVLAAYQQQGQKGGPPKDKFGNLLDTSKTCGYCQKVKKWRGIGHTEAECKTKKREKEGQAQGGQVKAAYEETDDFDIQSQLGGVKIGTLHIRMLHIGRVKRQNAGWYEFDTGAQAHTTNERWRLTDIKLGQNITGFNGTTTTSECSGTMTMRHGGRDIILKNVQYHPKFCNLISGQKIQNFSLISDNTGTRVQTDNNDTLYHISRGITGTMWIIPEDTKIVTLKVNKETLQGLHERYGHISFDSLKTLPEAKGLSGTGTCTACLKGKSTNPPSKLSPVGPIRTNRTMERIHADLIGPLSKEWLGKKYILTIMDDFSRYCTAIPIHDKTHASEKTKEWILALETTTGNKTAFIQTDWGTEFNNLKTWGTKRGTRTKETVPYHSETHAAIERLNRTLQNMARTAMIAAGLKGLWGDAIQWAAYTKNRVPHRSLKGKTPIEILLNKPVNRDNLRPFGQRVMAHLYKEQRERMDPRAIECRIMQYTETHGIYLVVSHSGKRFLTKDPRPVTEEESSDSENEPEQLIESSKEPPNEPPPAPRKSKRIEENLELGKGISNYQDLINRGLAGNRVGHDDDHPTEEQAQASPYAQEWAIARETERAKLRQYNVYTIVPQVPYGHRPVDTKWVYDVKRDQQGNLTRRRARKVGRGFTQEFGVNYSETFSQMSRSETWRILLVLAVQNNWAIRQWDVKAAYLQAPLTHEVYVQDINEKGQTEYWRLNKALYGLKQAGHEWYKTMKSIMNQVKLRQSIGDPGCFYNHETGLIISTHVDDMMAVAPIEQYLNDIEMAIEHHVELDKLGIPTKLLGMELTWTESRRKQVTLTQKTSIENLEKEHGLQASSVPTRSLPLNPILFEPPKEGEEVTPSQLQKYQSLVGSLLYINRCTRPEISIQVNLLGRRTSRASHNNIQAAMHVLRYLASSKEKGITIRQAPSGTKTPQENKGAIKAYADASYGGEQAKSQSGNLVMLNGQIVMWSSRRQDITAQSITEAEYIACSEGTKDIRWLQQLLEELPSQILVQPAYLYSDNEAAIKLTKTQTFHKRTRHIEHRYHYIRELVDQGKIQLRGITGKDNPSDILTKILPMSSVKEWMTKLGLE